MLVVEKYLDRSGGHETTQVHAIQNLVGNRSVIFVTGSQCNMTFDDLSTVLTVLSTRKDVNATPAQAVDHDFHAMRNVLLAEERRHEPILYVTAQTHDLRVALRLVSRVPLAQKVYMRVLLDREIAQLTDDERVALKSAVGAGRIVLLAETDSLAAFFWAHYGLDFHKTALCLPCSVVPGQTINFPSASRSKRRRFRVGCLGGWRTEKGVEALPQVIRHLRDALDSAQDAPKIEVIIQKRPSKKSFKGIKKSVKRDYPFWRSVGFPIPGKRLSLSFRTTNLSKEEFLATLMSVDLLLVPYRLEEYHHRGSGIILDGVAARKPIVYTRGMGMSEFLTHGNAEAASEDPKDYADKVVEILSNMEIYRTGADQAAVELETRIERAARFLRSI